LIKETYECLQYLDLIDKGLEVLQLLLLDGLDSVLLARLPVLGLVNDTETTRCQLLREVVLVLDLALVRLWEELVLVNVVALHLK
jgi:hypothetical protein